MKSLLYAGSFDPPTLGHMNIIQRAAGLVETLYIGIASNTCKSNFFSQNERFELLKSLTRTIKNSKIIIINGLVVDEAKIHGISHLVRSIRSPADLERELEMALANWQMAKIETIFLAAEPSLMHISSSLVREIARFGGTLDCFVDPLVIEALKRRN